MTGNRTTGAEAVIRIEAEAAAYGIKRTTDTHGRVRYEVTCGHCGKQDGMFNPAINHAEQVMSHFRKKGWIFAHRVPPYCSTQHVREAKRGARKDEEMETPAFAAPATVTAVAAVAPIPAIGSDIRLTLRVGAVIEDHFDRDKRLYHAGWSDELVANKTGAALEFAIKVRKEGFGELAEDPGATALRASIKTVEDKLFALSGEIDELKARLDRLAARAHVKPQG